jgi:hypothetical protein
MSTFSYLTNSRSPVTGCWLSVTTATAIGSLPYMLVPATRAAFMLTYSNCTTAYTTLPAAGEEALLPTLTAVDCVGPAMSDRPSGQSEKNWRPPAAIVNEVSMIGPPSLL